MFQPVGSEQTARISRRQVLKLGSLVGFGAVFGALAACQQPAASPAATAVPQTDTEAPAPTAVPAQSSTEPVTLIHSAWGALETPWGKYLTHHMDKFREANPNVTFEYQTAPWAEYHTKLLTQAAAGTAPDTFAQSNVYYPKYVSKGGSISLDDYVKRDPTFDVADFIPTSLRLSTHQAKLFGLPHISSCWVRVWHKDIFKEAGLASPNDLDAEGKWNWPAFLETATQLTQRDASGKATRLGFGDPGLNYLSVHQWAWQNGANMLKQPDLNEFVLNSPEGVEAVQFQADLLNKHKVAPLAGEILKDAPSDFNAGRIAMFDSWANFDYLQFKDFKHGDVVYPAQSATRAAILHTNSLGISSSTKIADTGWNWISQLGSKEGDKDQATFGIGIVLRSSNLPALAEINKTEYGVEHAEVVSDIISSGRTFDITPVYSEVEQAFNAAMDEVTIGKVSAKDALDKVKPEIDKILSTM